MTNDEFFDIGRVAYITGNVQEALAAKQTLEKVVENANSLQQLKAEIAEVCSYIDQTRLTGTSSAHILNHVYGTIRQLSAV